MSRMPPASNSIHIGNGTTGKKNTENPDIRPCGGREHKSTLFADDIIMMLSSPIIFIPNMLNTLQKISMILGLKVNQSKSQVLIFPLMYKLFKMLSTIFNLNGSQML